MVRRSNLTGEIKTLKENNIQIIPKTKVDAVLNSSEQPIQNDINTINENIQNTKTKLDELNGTTSNTIQNGLEELIQTKKSLKTAIINCGVEIPFGTSFSEYASKISEI